jgi:hypothetical protein
MRDVHRKAACVHACMWQVEGLQSHSLLHPLLLPSPVPDRTDDKIKKLDEQLAKYKDQIKRTRPGPAQDAIKRRALQV